MRKFLTISVCMFVSLVANATVSVTKSADGRADSITISGGITSDEVTATKAQLKRSILKIATNNYQLNKSDWEKIINPWGDNLILDKVANLDLGSVRFSDEVMVDDAKNNIGGKIGNHSNITKLTWSRYNDVPSQCFNGNNTIREITIPNKQEGDENITICSGAFSEMKQLLTLTIGSCVAHIEPSMCECSGKGISKLNTVIFNTDIKVIPSSSFKFCEALKRIDLPTNTEEIGEGAFENCSLETIAFPNTLKVIRKNAFDFCNLEYVVIPENVELIETEAFQRNAKLTDVYVMGSKAKCQENGFSKEQNCGGFKNYKNGYTEDDPASREDWTNDNDITPVILHFVGSDEDSRVNYENPYWTMLNTPGIIEELKGYNTSDEGQKEFIEKYGLQHKNEFPWDLYYFANGTKEAPFAYYKYKDNDGKDRICKIWRQEYGYYASEKIKETGEDYAGWKQFLIIQDDAKQNTFDDEHRIDDRWYSMCFPFDLNANQIRTAYGAGTEVCEFIGAWKTEQKDEKGNNIVCFRYKPLLNDTETASLDNNEDDTRAAAPIITHANHPYMIHPASKKEGDNTNVWHRIIPGIPMDEQKGDPTKLITIDPNDNKQEIMDRFGDDDIELLTGFKFVGNYTEDIKIPGNTYYFAYRDHEDGSRTLVLNHLTKESARNYWDPMTALVVDESKGASTTFCAKKLSFNFNPAGKGTTTGINDVNMNENVASKANQDSKIYNLNGQVVKEGNNLNGLDKGIYILNGRKYIVK